MFHTGFVVDSVSLTSVLSDVGVDKVDNIGSDTDAEDSREDNVGSGGFNSLLSAGDVVVVHMDDLSMDHGDK
jgi:hypothetical protein